MRLRDFKAAWEREKSPPADGVARGRVDHYFLALVLLMLLFGTLIITYRQQKANRKK